MAVETSVEFIATYGNPDKPLPVFEAGPEAKRGQVTTVEGRLAAMTSQAAEASGARPPSGPRLAGSSATSTGCAKRSH